MRTVFTKTIYEKRWTILFWALGVAAMAMMTLSFYNSFKQGGFDEAFNNLPKPLRALAGNLASNKNVPGFVAQQVFALRVPLLTLVMGVTLFTSLLAGDEGEGTLQTLLVQPVSRLRVLIEKYVAGMIISLIVCAGSAVGVLLALLIIGEQMSLLKLVEAVVGVWLLTLVFGTIGFAIGAITGKRSLAAGIAGLFTFGSYLVTSLSANVASLETIQRFSPFHYYNVPAIAQYGLKASNVLVMVGICAGLLIISGIVFKRRDIYQR